MEILRNNLWFTALLVLCNVATAQQEAPFVEQAQKKFEYGLLQFGISHWQNAAKQFEEVAQKYPLNHRTTAAYVMAARAFLLDGKPSVSLRLIEEMQQRFPGSNYLAEAYLIGGDAAISAGSRSTALRWYVLSWLEENCDRATLTQRIGALETATIPTAEQRGVRDLLSNTTKRDSLQALLGWEMPLLAAGTKEPLAAAGRQQVLRTSIEPARIAVALPMHELDPLRAGIVRDIRDGILAAVDLHRTDGKQPVMMELFDSSNEDSTRNAIERLEHDDRAMVLIAGAFSEDAERVSRIAAERGMLVLIPTATAEGITKLGSNIFQLNTPILQRARLLADFTYLELDIQEAIVIAPDHSYARAMANAFMERCQSLNIPVHLAGWYGKNSEDVRSVCRKISDPGVKNCILFAPVQSRDDIVAVLDGIREARLNVRIVGGGNWNHPDLLALYGKNMTLFFESDVVEDTSSVAYVRLREAFTLRSTRPLSREALFGYDAMHIALSLINSESCSRKTVRERIANLFDGLRAPVNFMQQRVNGAINILVCRDGVIMKQEPFYAK